MLYGELKVASIDIHEDHIELTQIDPETIERRMNDLSTALAALEKHNG